MADEPSMWDLQHLIERNHADGKEDIADLKAQLARDTAHITSQLDRYLPREVYNAREETRTATQNASDRRIGLLEEDAKDTRRRASTAFYAAVGAIISGIVVGVALVVIMGGKP